MAELGVIDRVDTNRGVGPVSRNSELQGLSSALGLTDKIIDEAAKADLRGDLEQATEDVIESAAAADAGRPEVETFESQQESEAVVSFVNQMRKHAAMAQQASSSGLRARAVLAMQRELQNAKNKYPWMRATLDQEANRFMGNNPTLTELGMVDAAINAGTHPSAQSQDWIEGIKQQAYGKGPNELGMDERIEFGTVEFARQYDRKMKRLQERQALERDEALAKAQDTADIRQLVTVGTKQLESAEGTLTALYDDMTVELGQIHDARSQFRQGRILESQLLEQEDQWQREVKPTLLLRLQNARLVMRDKYNELIPFHLQDEPDAAALNNRVNQHSQDIETIEAAISADNTNVVDLIRTLSLLRGQRRLETAPTLREFTDLANISEKALTAMGAMDFTFASAYDQQLISNGMGPEIMTSMFPSLAADYIVSGGNLPPEERRRRRQEAYTRSNSPGGRVETNDPKVVATDAVGQILRNVNAIGTPELRDPVADRMYVGGTAAKLQELATAMPGGLADENILDLRDAMSSTNWVKLVDDVGRNDPNVREWVANVEQDYLGVIDKPRDWANSILELAQDAQDSGGTGRVRAINLLDIDHDNLVSTGQLSFMVNEEAINAAFPLSETGDSPRETSFFGLGESRNDRVRSKRQQVKRDMEAIARRLTEDATAYIRVQAHLSYAKNPSLTQPEYTKAFIQPVPGAQSIAAILNINPEELSE